MHSDISNEEFAAALDATAADILWEAGISEPPVDALAVADGLDLVVVHDFAMPYRGRFVRLANKYSGDEGQGTIVVGNAERPEREQWAIAHEIGESVACRVFERLGVLFDESLSTERERVANRFASALLLPRRWLSVDGPNCDWDLPTLKGRYATVSHELIARRMLEMRPSIVITICDNEQVRYRRSNAASRAPDLLAEERAAWHECHRSGLPSDDRIDSETGLERVRAWPIHEPDWKREILRSEIVEI